MQYLCKVEYIGTNYKGWVGNSLCVSDIIKNYLQSLFCHPIKIKGSSRTDKGVHALENYFTFRGNRDIYPLRIQIYLNKKLPCDISILWIEYVNSWFNIRETQKFKTYKYYIALGGCNGFDKLRMWILYDVIDIDKLRRNLLLFKGPINYQNYIPTCYKLDRKIFTIEDINVHLESNIIVISFASRFGFFTYQLRYIVGTAIKNIDNYPLLIQSINNYLSSFNILKAPPWGLSLYSYKISV